MKALEIMRLSEIERDRLLAREAELAAEEYRSNTELTDFEAFDYTDFEDEYELGPLGPHRPLHGQDPDAELQPK